MVKSLFGEHSYKKALGTCFYVSMDWLVKGDQLKYRMTYIIFLHIANELDPVLFVSQLQIVFHFPTRVFLQPVVLVIPDSYYFPDAEKYVFRFNRD